MARRKRIPYDPPARRKHRFGSGGRSAGRSAVDKRADQHFLSRRMFIAKAGVIGAFSALAGRLGYLQLIEGEKYQVDAEENYRKVEVMPAPRGMIVDRMKRPLAQNRRAWEVQIVKGELPDEVTHAAERRRVLDSLISALQLENVLAIRPKAIPSRSRDTIFSRVTKMLNYDDETADRAIARWIREWGDRYVKVTPLTIDDAALFREAQRELPGVVVMNEIDFLLENVWAEELPITIKKDVPREVALKLEANSMYMPGVVIDDSALAREYVRGEVMSHVLGYVQPISRVALDDLRNRDAYNERIYDQNDIIGHEGLEGALERDLRGIKGRQQVEIDANGVVLRTLPGTVAEAVPGKNIRLTIDLELQNAAAKALVEAIERAAAAKEKVNTEERTPQGRKTLWQIPNAGSVVALDPRTGEILAMVSYPYYDNQLFVTGLSSRKFKEYTEAGKAFLNRTTNELYPPGSTFKIFLAASALAHGAITPDKTYKCTGAIQVPYTNDLSKGNPSACWVGWRGGTHETLDLYGAIAQSCDVYFYNVAEANSQEDSTTEPVYYYDWNLLGKQIVSQDKHVFNGLGIEPLAKDMQERFWFGRETGVEINEASGLFPDPAWKLENIAEGWSTGDTLNVSIGQGEVKVTPLQLAMNTASLATNGIFRKPHLVLDKTVGAAAPEPTPVEEIGKLEIDQNWIDVVKEGMWRVCHDPSGTAYRVNRDDPATTKWPKTNSGAEQEIFICGKTGTAEFGEEDELGARDTHALFTCFAPAEAPEIVVAVVIEAGGEGATHAVPVADEVLRAFFELTGKRARGVVLSPEGLPVPT
ncbi:MAG: penicillin-binding protein 2 [Chloroflexia bacterium]|nr:penicillin-binding protein 2 [Chloroflexia bacterium]